LIETTPGARLAQAIGDFAAPFALQAGSSELQAQRAAIDAHFGAPSVAATLESLARDDGAFAQNALAAMRQRSPLMMCVTRAMLARGAGLGVADCLRMERSVVRRNFEHGEVLEGVRALVIDKDNAPQWNPPTLAQVTPAMVEHFFAPVWPAHAHPLRHL
jgi:enoyl-CoA hydratase/carnithine racemase